MIFKRGTLVKVCHSQSSFNGMFGIVWGLSSHSGSSEYVVFFPGGPYNDVGVTIRNANPVGGYYFNASRLEKIA